MKSRIFKPPQGEVSTKDILDIIDSQKNVADGIAGLDSNALVNLANLPLIPASQLDFSFAWEKVAEISATGVATVDITGLEGDTDKLYMLVLSFVNPNTTVFSIYAQCNSDTNVSNYSQGGLGQPTLTSTGASGQGFGSTTGVAGMRVGQPGGENSAGFFVAFINTEGITVGTKTYVFAVSLGINTPGIGDRVSWGGWIKSAEVTSLTLFNEKGLNLDWKVYIFKPKW